MTARLPIGLRARLALTLCATALSSCTLSHTLRHVDAKEGRGDTLVLSVDNDSYSFDDGNYTNGVELAWISAPLDGTRYDEEHPARRMADAFAVLPGLTPLGGAESALFAAVTLSHLTFTPEDLGVRNPAPTARPYAGVLALDASVMRRTEDSVTGYVLRLGWVGEASFAEELQKEIHPWFGAEDPRGWNRQLDDEPIVNAGFTWRRRVARGSLGDALEWDATPELNAAAGTYYTGASAGVRVRFGPDVPDDLPLAPPRTGFEVHPVAGQASGPDAAWYGFWEAAGHGVAHYLPIDGTVFRDSRTAEGEPFVGSTSIGASFGRGRWVLTLAYSFLTDAYEAQSNRGQFGTISLAWHR